MYIKAFDIDFTVCRLKNTSEINPDSEFCFFARTDEEISLVCPTEKVPKNTEKREDGWKCFRIDAVLDFSLTGILADISELLSENNIGIFAVSTYNTDYIFVKEDNFELAIDLLCEHGYDMF